MPLLTNILLIAALLLLTSLALRIGHSLKTIGMPALLAIIVTYALWVGGNLMELNASDFQWALWGRNIQQIGVFFTPLFTLFFSADYTANGKLRKYAVAIGVIQTLSVLLIFTDQTHHLMRESVALQPNAVLENALVVRSTKIGTALVAFNFCIPLISVVNLMAFSRKVTSQLKRPIWLIIISMVATFLLALVQSVVLGPLGVNIPIPVLNLPCLMLFSYAVLKKGFVGVTPTALSKVFEVIDQGIVVVDEYGRIIECNRRAVALMAGVFPSRPFKIGMGIMAFLFEGKPDAVSPFAAERLPAELKNTQNSQYVAVACHALDARRGKRIGYVLVFTDITLMKAQVEMDFLTGSYNREGLSNAFADLQEESDRLPFISALIIDMDDFKAINDTYGHLGGDLILCDFVNMARTMLPEKCFLGRLGGDEFVAILPAGLAEAAELAEKLRQGVSARAVPYMDLTIRYTISVGISACNNEDCQLSELLDKADLALYEAKHQGKNCVYTRTAVR